MKQLTTGKIFGLCMGDFARGMINGIVTTYLLTFFLPTKADTTLPQFFLKLFKFVMCCAMLSRSVVTNTLGSNGP